MKEAILLCGGPSEEYAVSLCSAAEVLRHAEKTPYNLTPVLMTKAHDFFVLDASPCDIENGTPKTLSRLFPMPNGFLTEDMSRCLKPRVIFPLMHGAFGEDGGVQGLLSYVGLPFVGCKTEASSIAMNKMTAKRLAASAGIPVLKAVPVCRDDFDMASSLLGLPFFVKPISGGSSIGAGIVRDRRDFLRLLSGSPSPMMAEMYVRARELEVAVIETENGVVPSLPGEVIPSRDFYDYEDKYKSNAARLLCPADCEDSLKKELSRLAVTLFSLFGCRGLARIDFFYTEDGRIFFNEINTMPGFTKDSLYPRLICHSLGISESELLTALLSFAEAHP